MLPAQWLLYLTILLSNIFSSGCYPAQWTYAKLNMLFKKGDKSNCDNYRGISIINSVAKVYDYVLCNRLSKWFSPEREQAGAQPGHGCTEHLVTLRLIMNYCFRKRVTLYIAYIDFSKAYDRVPRNKLLDILKRLGCGLVMLTAIATMYKVTKSILGMAVITAIVGVRQGSPTSCFLFIVYVNVLIRMVKERCASDSFLQWLHVLMLMDDTVIFASSRERLIEKLKVLGDFCDSHGMVINKGKTKFMVINGRESDKLPIHIGDIVIEWCYKYTYLGSVFTTDGSTRTALQEHVNAIQKHLNKLILFLNKNVDMPFFVKRKVVDAAFNAAILYGCESWIDVNLKPVEKLYNSALRHLLGVRNTTSTDLLLVECGFPPLHALVKHKQQTFFNKMISERRHMSDDPLMFALDLTRVSNKRTYSYIDQVMNGPHYITSALGELHHRIAVSDRTKYRTYREINPELSVHAVYSERPSEGRTSVPELYRKSFTRMRLSSHRLKIETGRWSRIPQEQRLCQCGLSVQDKQHILVNCPLTQHLRTGKFKNVDHRGVLQNATSSHDYQYVHESLMHF